MSEHQLEYSRLPPPSLTRAFAHKEPLTFWFIAAAIGTNALMACLAIVAPDTFLLVAWLFSPCINWLFGAAGVIQLPWVYHRSSSTMFAIHAVLAIALPWVLNNLMGMLAGLVYPH